MYVVNNRGYLPVREQQLSSTSSPPMHSTAHLHHHHHPDIDEKSFDRVHQWIAQQHKFAGLPPPDEESFFRTNVSADIGGAKDLASSSVADSHSLTDWCNHPYVTDDELYRFGGLEMNRYYSPNMTRKRGYVPRSEASLNNGQLIINTSRSSIPQLSRPHNGDHAERSIASSSRDSPIAWAPYNRYYFHSGEGNTFPRRNKINKEEKRNLFSSSIMENNHSVIRPINRLSYSDDPFLSRNIETSLTNRKIPERMLTANQYSTASHLSNSECVEQVLDDDVINAYKASPSGLKYSAASPQEVKSIITEKNNSIIGSMSLDTQRLLTGNLPDVALTAAKALHKRELSDSLPKYPKGPIKTAVYQHVRMSSAPIEQTDPNSTATLTDSNSSNSNGSKNMRNKNLSNCAEVRKVKAFSWPKRAMLPPSTTKELLNDEFVKNKKKDNKMENINTTMKTEESGYNTEKSEDKNEASDEQNKAIYICEEVLDKTLATIDTLESIDDTLDTRSLSKESNLSGRSLTKETGSLFSRDNDNKSVSKESLSKESVASDHSENPPARPPLPSPQVYADKKSTTSPSTSSPSFEMLSESRDAIIVSSASPPLDSRLSNVQMRSSFIRMSSPDVRYATSDVRHSPSEAPLRRSIAVDQLSNINHNVPKNNGTTPQSQYTSMKYLRNRDLSADCTVSAFCSSTTDLTRNVSMSLKDLIRIHEQEIARVSGAHGGNSTSGRLKNHDFMRKCSISDAKARSKSVWKRHTTIGLLTSFDDEKTLLELANNCDAADKLSNNISLSNNNTSGVTSSSSKETTTSPTPPVVSAEISDDGALSPPYSPTSHTSSGNSFNRKRSAPLTLPKPAVGLRSSLQSLVEVDPTPSLPDVPTPASLDELTSILPQQPTKSTPPNFTVASTSPSPPFHKDACVQTDTILSDMSQTDANGALLFAKERKELEMKFEKEKQVMQRKLDEQKKVANAYQKLEDRYRRKVYELQKALHTCTCNRGKQGNAETNQFVENSFTKYSISPDTSHSSGHDMSVQKVDGILHQLEAWLNNQTSGMNPDTSELSSLIGSTEENMCSPPRYRHRDHYTSPPLEIIDQIDATSV